MSFMLSRDKEELSTVLVLKLDKTTKTNGVF